MTVEELYYNEGYTDGAMARYKSYIDKTCKLLERYMDGDVVEKFRNDMENGYPL